MNLNEADKLWMNAKPVEGILYFYNDSVRITSGEHSGQFASVISLVSMDPVTFLIELGNGDLIIEQTELVKDDTSF